MPFGIGRGVAEVQILKNSETGPISWKFLNILIKLCINIAIDVRGIAKCHFSSVEAIPRSKS